MTAAALEICALGSSQADLPAIAGLRKTRPDWAPADTPGHFLKYADEQTVVAVAAVDRAIQANRDLVGELKNWSIVVAPRFVGRIGGVATLERFGRGGGPAISPHLIPQHSLHSASGALSILLASRCPNLGVGGGADAVTEGFLTALTLPPHSGSRGVWLICTAWDREPVQNLQGECTNAPTCYAVALALQSAAASHSYGRLQLDLNQQPSASPATNVAAAPSVPELCAAVDALSRGKSTAGFRWQLPWGATLALDLHAAAAQRLAAA
jgi:hypothetical protein